MDLTGNSLAGRLDSIAAVPATPIDDHDNDDSDRHSTEGAQADERVPPADSGTHIDGGGTDRYSTADECDSTAVVLHPLLSDAEWRDLDRLAPELTRSIGDLSVLKDALLRLERPLGPDHAMTVVNGIETATRVLEAMSAVALSVYDGAGHPPTTEQRRRRRWSKPG